MKEYDSFPLVSVVIPAYNAEKYIEEAINSVLNQTFQDFEVIVIDDGSQDSTKEKVLNYSDSRIKYIYKENGGPSTARNAGIKNAKGEYIAFLDYDDIWMPQKLERQLAKFSLEPDLGLVYSWVQSINPDGSTRFVSEPENEGWVHNEIILDNFQHNGSIQLVKKECFEKAGYFDESLLNAQDWDMWIRLAKYYKFGVVKEILVRYRVRSDSLSKRHRRLNKAFIRIMDKHLKDADKSVKRQKNNLYSGHYYLIFRRCCVYDNDKLCALKYLFLSFYYDPVYLIKKTIWEKIISNFKLILSDTAK